MKIVAPANSLNDVIFYIEKKVDEIYFGFKDPLSKKWSTINKRNEFNGNIESIDDLNKIRDLKKANKDLFFPELSLTLNSSYFDDQMIEEFKKQIILTKDIVDNYIIADVSLINVIKSLAPNNGIILSCIGVCLNSKSASFYLSLGIKKIILPRHLKIKEIELILKNNSSAKFEVMVLNQFCKNIDGFCSRCHIPTNNGEIANCRLPYELNFTGTLNYEIVKKNLNLKLIHDPFCAICFLKEFSKIGVDSLKIVGRTNNYLKKKNDILMLQDVFNLFKLNDDDYKKECKKIFKKYTLVDCKNNCYY